MIDPRNNHAWQQAEALKSRMNQHAGQRSSNPLKGVLVWLSVAALMVTGLFMASILLLIGLVTLPFLRHRIKKQTTTFSGTFYEHRTGNSPDSHRVIEGDYQARP